MRSALLRQLRRRFTALTPDVEQRVANGTKPELERWIDRVLGATSLDDVFAKGD